MDIEKIFVYGLFVMIFLPLLGLGAKEYQASQCRIEAIKANWEPDKIIQVCGK